MTLNAIGGSWKHNPNIICPCCGQATIEYIDQPAIRGDLLRTYYHCFDTTCPAWYIVDSWRELIRRCAENKDSVKSE